MRRDRRPRRCCHCCCCCSSRRRIFSGQVICDSIQTLLGRVRHQHRDSSSPHTWQPPVLTAQPGENARPRVRWPLNTGLSLSARHSRTNANVEPFELHDCSTSPQVRKHWNAREAHYCTCRPGGMGRARAPLTLYAALFAFLLRPAEPFRTPARRVVSRQQEAASKSGTCGACAPFVGRRSGQQGRGAASWRLTGRQACIFLKSQCNVRSTAVFFAVVQVPAATNVVHDCNKVQVLYSRIKRRSCIL